MRCDVKTGKGRGCSARKITPRGNCTSDHMPTFCLFNRLSIESKSSLRGTEDYATVIDSSPKVLKPWYTARPDIGRTMWRDSRFTIQAI
jgi:hypothetical protein